MPKQANEELKDLKKNIKSLEVVAKIAEAAGITDFTENQVDVCHRVSRDDYAPIIVRFFKMDDRFNMYAKRFSLAAKKLTPQMAGLVENEEARMTYVSEMKKANKNFKHSRPAILIQDHLTKKNASLLKEAKKKGREFKYTYPGYVYDNEVRVRRADGERFIPIRNMNDLELIVPELS